MKYFLIVFFVADLLYCLYEGICKIFQPNQLLLIESNPLLELLDSFFGFAHFEYIFRSSGHLNISLKKLWLLSIEFMIKGKILRYSIPMTCRFSCSEIILRLGSHIVCWFKVEIIPKAWITLKILPSFASFLLLTLPLL